METGTLELSEIIKKPSKEGTIYDSIVIAEEILPLRGDQLEALSLKMKYPALEVNYEGKEGE